MNKNKEYSLKQMLIMVLHEYEEDRRWRIANPYQPQFTGICYSMWSLWDRKHTINYNQFLELKAFMLANEPPHDKLFTNLGERLSKDEDEGFWWVIEDTESRVKWLKTKIKEA